jgi:hypothetical protein
MAKRLPSWSNSDKAAFILFSHLWSLYSSNLTLSVTSRFMLTFSHTLVSDDRIHKVVSKKFYDHSRGRFSFITAILLILLTFLVSGCSTHTSTRTALTASMSMSPSFTSESPVIVMFTYLSSCLFSYLMLRQRRMSLIRRFHKHRHRRHCPWPRLFRHVVHWFSTEAPG